MSVRGNYIDYGRGDAPPERDQADLQRRMGAVPADTGQVDVLRALAHFGPHTAVKLLRYFAALEEHEVEERHREPPWGQAPAAASEFDVIFKDEGEHAPVPVEEEDPKGEADAPKHGGFVFAPEPKVHYWDEAPESIIPAALLAAPTQEWLLHFQYSYTTSAGRWFTATEAIHDVPPAEAAEAAAARARAEREAAEREARERAIAEREAAEHEARE